MINKFGSAHLTHNTSTYRRCAAATRGTCIDVIEDMCDSFVHYQADNMDHASRTLDGHGSVHVMGQMATFTPAIVGTRKVPRIKVSIIYIVSDSVAGHFDTIFGLIDLLLVELWIVFKILEI